MKNTIFTTCLLVFIAFTLPAQAEKQLTILHFNDVYEIEAQNKGKEAGLGRALTVIKQNKDTNPLILFSGDAFGSSALSTQTYGKHMIEAFNLVGLHVASCGNHEFDFGLDITKQRIGESKFTWLCTNLFEPNTNKPVAGMKKYEIIDHNGIRVAILGLAEDFRRHTALNEKNSSYTHFIKAAKEGVAFAKENKADVIIALTHMDFKNDKQLAGEVPELDLILGGHDHEPMQTTVNDTLIWKSGSDWFHIGKIVLNIDNQNVSVASKENIKLDESISEDPQAKPLITKYVDDFNKSLSEVVAVAKNDLDCIRVHVRTQETNFANLVADSYQEHTNADFALTNGGGLRTDAIIPKGNLTKKQILTAVPFSNKVVKIELTGEQVWQALENGVSQIEDVGGGFLQTSKNLKYSFDIKQPVGKRIQNVWVKGEPLDKNKTYQVATNDYVAKFEPFHNGKFLIKPDVAKLDYNVVIDYLKNKKEIEPKIEGRIVRTH